MGKVRGGMMVVQLLIGGVLIAVTVIFQAVVFDIIISHARRLESYLRDSHRLWKALFITLVVMSVSLVLIVEIWMWAVLYLAIGAQPDLESALYFSTTSFSTAGFGDVVLPPDWRLLSGIEATNGFLMFSWAAAFIFEIVSGVYRKESKGLDR